ncbi:nitrate reductase [Usitatibacter palustris]|uniref:Nitrate reductase n=1 Tax=Usitatibacter palustris TaxID=2732487 RepID=A0A6M4H3Y1_9PROT|nr:nitrate reductase [Usitatibacter palustris]QJR14045.1 Nitrate reductase [Usitatibacter palustris]
MKETRSTCCYCGVGCGVVITSEGERITAVRGDADHPSNRGRLCTKGSTLHLTASPAASAGRATHPEMRRDRALPRGRFTWDETLDHVADRFAACIREHGPDSVAFYISGQLLTEDYYVFNKLAKGLIGTANVDTNSRLCMSSAVTGYQQTLGVDAPPCSYEDLDHAQCLFIAGSNTAHAHPVLFRRIEAARERNPALKVIVVDPRRTETARFADLHLPILPGTDVALFHAMLHLMLWDERIDREYIAAHVEGFDELRVAVREWTPAVAAEVCGVKAEDIATAAKWFATSPATLSLYCQGLNQSSSGTAKNAALVNLHLATGQIGRPGAGPFSLTGQPNAMGGREVGGLATTLAAHRSLTSAIDRAEMARLWGVDRVPDRAGKTAVELFDALHSGEVRMVWIACTNPAQSMPNLPKVHEALARAELVVLQEAYRDTETAPFADVLLPATTWGEKEGTVTNSERRITRVRAAVAAPGEARDDWAIAVDFARRLETRLAPGKPSIFPFESPEAVWNEHREATRGRDLDITGLTYAMLEREPQQWPFPEGASEGRVRLYTDGVFHTPTGKAKFFTGAYRPVAEKADARFPLQLTTGRLRDHWHGMSRTGNVAQLFGHVPEPRLGMSATDMTRRGLADGELVRIQSRRGAIHVLAAIDPELRSGQVYLPMHWGKRFLGGKDSAGTNTITNPAFDRDSRQPELKHASVKVEAVALPWRLAGFAEIDGARLVEVLEGLRELQQDVTFLSVVPMGRDRPGVLVRAAHSGAPADGWATRLDALLGLIGEGVLRYDDARRGGSRRVLVADDRLVAARLSGGEEALASAEWLKDWLASGQPVGPVRRFLLMPSAKAPSGFVSAGRTVCQCFGVTATAIDTALAGCAGSAAERLASLQAQLQCGTNCGSCMPELRERVAASASADSSGRRVA